MKKDTLINLRINKDLKDVFQSVVENEGFTMSEVLEATMKDIANRGYVPINIRTKIKKTRPTLSIPFIKKCVDDMIAHSNNKKIRSISLFGSYAKGIATPKSDVDLFLDVEEGFSLFDLAGIQNELEVLLGKKVDLVTRTDDEYFINHIQREKIQLYEKTQFA